MSLISEGDRKEHCHLLQKLGMEEPVILYETIGDLGASAAPETPPSMTESSSDSFENYKVFRNLISLSSAQCASPESAAPEYFSLELNDLEEDKKASCLDVPIPRQPEEASTPGPERTLEGSWFSDNSCFRSPMLRLHKEILDFCSFLSPTTEEQEHRNAAVESVFGVIKYIWPNATPEIFGSFKTGLYLPSSDIDVVILDSNIRSPQAGLQALSRALSQRGIAKKMQVIAKARVPIIKFVEKRSGIAFDISFDAHNGPQAAEFIKDAVSKWPPLRPLCLILKVFLQQRELNEVYTGGIGSYALLSMLIAMLRNQLNHRSSIEHNLGILLVNFFDTYGCKLNTVDVGISCNGRGMFFPKSSKGFSVEKRPSLIAIEDPQAPDNDIGKSSFNYYQVKSAFAMAFSTLTNPKVILQLGLEKSILGAIIRPDAVLLERKGGSTGKVTFNALFPGAGERVELLENQQEIYCNWHLVDEDEESLPRGNRVTPEPDATSSGKKRKSPKKKSSRKKSKRFGTEVGIGSSEKNGKTKDLTMKKQSRKHYQSGTNTNRLRH